MFNRPKNRKQAEERLRQIYNKNQKLMEKFFTPKNLKKLSELIADIRKEMPKPKQVIQPKKNKAKADKSGRKAKHKKDNVTE